MNWTLLWVLAGVLASGSAETCHTFAVQDGDAIRRVSPDGSSYWTLSSPTFLLSLLTEPEVSSQGHRTLVLTFGGIDMVLHSADDAALPLNVSAHFKIGASATAESELAQLRAEIRGTPAGQVLTFVFTEFPRGRSATDEVHDGKGEENVLHVKFTDYISFAPMGPWSHFVMETREQSQLELHPCVDLDLHLNTFTYTTILQAEGLPPAPEEKEHEEVHAKEREPPVREEEEDVLLQVDAGATTHAVNKAAFSIPGLQDILKVFLKLLMPPVFDPVLEKLNDHLEHVLAETVAKDIVSTTPKDVMAMLEPDLRRNLTNLLVDTVTAAVTQDLCVKLTATLTPPLTERLVTLLETDLRQRLTKKLQQLVTLRLDTTLPTMLHRSLLTSLTETLSLSLPPTITAGLATLLLNHNDPHLHRFPSIVPLTEECDKCQSDVNQPDKSACWACREDALEFQTLQHAHYASEYYSRYYAQYYTKAAWAIDAAKYPPAGEPTPKP